MQKQITIPVIVALIIAYCLFAVGYSANPIMYKILELSENLLVRKIMISLILILFFVVFVLTLFCFHYKKLIKIKNNKLFEIEQKKEKQEKDIRIFNTIRNSPSGKIDPVMATVKLKSDK